MVKRDKWFLKGGRGSGKTFRLICDVYENRIVDLKQENERIIADYKGLYELREEENREVSKKIETLEKENVELIHENVKLVDVINKSKSYGISPLNYLIIKNLENQLTKAKEIIKGLLTCCRNYPQENADKIEQALQFIKEIEK